jgi:hypothetical protein
MEYDMSMTYGENLALVYEQSTLAPNIGYGKDPKSNQIQKTVNYPKGFVKSKGWVVDGKKVEVKGTNIREIISNLRDFFFNSTLGFAADILISVAGVEVGGPIIMRALEFTFLVNDLEIYYRQPDDFKNKGFMEKFSDQSNLTFQNVIVDLFVIGTFGLIRSVSGVRSALNKNPNAIREMISKCKGFISSVSSVLGNLGDIGKWLGPKLDNLSTFLDSLVTSKNVKTAVKSTAKSIPNKFFKYIEKVLTTVPKNIPRASVEFIFSVMIMKFGEKMIDALLSKPSVVENIAGFTTKNKGKVTEELIGDFLDSEIERQVLIDNPNLKPPVRQIDDMTLAVGNPQVKYVVNFENPMKLIKKV